MIPEGPARNVDSLLDRLLDRSRGVVVGRGAAYESVRRDLENLLNTRWRCVAFPADLEELQCSLVNYGIPDFTGATFNNPISQRNLRRVLQQCIERFEPRLKNVQVKLIQERTPQDRTLRFRIEAELRGIDEQRVVAFETALDPSTSTFRVGQAGR